MICRCLIFLVFLLAGSSVRADGQLRIWVGNGASAAALRQASAAYAASTGITITVEVVAPLLQRFATAPPDDPKSSPDIIYLSHDRLAGLAADGLIAPVHPSAAWAAGVLPVALQAVRFDGSIWAYPVAVEALHLIYNRAVIAAPPTSFEAIPGLPLPQGNRRILWDYANPYFTLPLLLGGVDPPFDPAHSGLGGPAALAGAKMLQSLVAAQFLPPEISYAVMSEAMNGGRVGMVIDGPWAWENLTISGIDFGVAPIPGIGGQPAPSLVTVQVLAINAASPDRELAARVIESVLTSDAGLALWTTPGRAVALADLSAAAAQTDPHAAAMLAIAAQGIALPDHRVMQPYWTGLRRALTAITSGTQPPADALADALANAKAAAAARLVPPPQPADSG